MEKKVKSISEAFSMQPIKLTVVDESNQFAFNPENDIKEIKLEGKLISSDELISVYRGYNFNGKILFEYVAKAVNVHY